MTFLLREPKMLLKQLNGIQHIRAALNEIRNGDNSELSENNGILDTDIERDSGFNISSFHFLSTDIMIAKLSSEHANRSARRGCSLCHRSCWRNERGLYKQSYAVSSAKYFTVNSSQLTQKETSLLSNDKILDKINNIFTWKSLKVTRFGDFFVQISLLGLHFMYPRPPKPNKCVRWLLPCAFSWFLWCLESY